MKKELNFLFVTIDGGGNIPPVLGLARRLSEKGHKISVLTEPCLEATVKEYGLYYIPFQKHFTRTNRKEDICKDWNASPFNEPTFDNIVFGPARIVVAETVKVLEQIPTDVIVVDILLPTALIAGEYLQVPRVIVFHMPEYLPGPNIPPAVMGLLPGKGFFGHLRDKLLSKLFHFMLNKYLPLVNEVRKSYNLVRLERMVDLIHQADLRLIQTAKNFDFPIEPNPGNVKYTGPVLDDPDWVEPWQSPWPQGDPRPLVVVSFSSTFQNQVVVIRRCIEALKGLNVRGLFTLGLAIDQEKFEVPENIKVVTSAPHSQVFPLADLVITHAGHGTIMRSLANGLPMICLPMGRDQNGNAAKIAYHGCGIRLNKNAKPVEIRHSILNILKNENFKQKASLLQKEIKEEAAKNLAIIELENLGLNELQHQTRKKIFN
ncbi:glycosyltransferase [soil metagenome]